MATVVDYFVSLLEPFALVAIACAPFELLAGERQGISNRIRGALFFAIFLAAYAIALVSAQTLVKLAGLRPLITVDFGSFGAGAGWLLHFPLAVMLSLIPFLIFDLFYYWFHRLQHAVPLLWQFHAVHHSIEELNATNCHHHWTEGLLRMPLIILPLMLLFELRGVSEIAALGFILGTWGQIVHVNIRMTLGPLEWLLVSPRFHRIHHSLDERHKNKNFAGLFSMFDLIFGTAYFPNTRESIKTGLHHKHEPVTLFQYLISLRNRTGA